MTALLGGFQQLQRTILKNHVMVRRDDVDTVGLDDHSVLNLVNRHPCIAPDQIGKNAFVGWVQMLHQDKGHTELGVVGNS